MNKQIEEMRKFVRSIPYISLDQTNESLVAQFLVNEGYRKQVEGENISKMHPSDIIENAPTADVVPMSECKRCGEKTREAIESLQGQIANAKAEVEEYRHNWQKIHDSYTADCLEHYNKGRSEVAREIFEEIERVAMSKIDENAPISTLDDIAYIQAIDEVREKYTEGEK